MGAQFCLTAQNGGGQERIGHTVVVRDGQMELLFFVMPEEYLDRKRRVKTEAELLAVLRTAPRDDAQVIIASSACRLC